MQVLVTGSSGQVGSYVVDLLRARDHTVVGLDLRPSPWTVHVEDIRDMGACTEAMAGCDAVVHCAAHVSVHRSIEDPSLDASTNILGTLNLLEAAHKEGTRRFVNVSSAAVYGDPDALPIPETHPLRPMSPYGVGKVAAETYCNVYRDLHGMEAVTVRPFNIYSPRQDPDNPYSGVISRFLSAARSGEPLNVFGDGAQTRDFVHAQDVAEALLLLATGPLPEARCVNLGTGTATSVSALAAMVSPGPRPGIVHLPARPSDIRHSRADTRLAASIPWQPGVGLREGLKAMAGTQEG